MRFVCVYAEQVGVVSVVELSARDGLLGVADLEFEAVEDGLGVGVVAQQLDEPMSTLQPIVYTHTHTHTHP